MIFVGYPNGQKGYKFLTQLLGAWSCRSMRSFTRTSPGVIMRRQVRSLLSLTTLAPSPHQQMDDVDMVAAPAAADGEELECVVGTQGGFLLNQLMRQHS